MGELGLSLGSRWKFYHKVLRLIDTDICSPRGSCSVTEVCKLHPLPLHDHHLEAGLLHLAHAVPEQDCPGNSKQPAHLESQADCRTVVTFVD